MSSTKEICYVNIGKSVKNFFNAGILPCYQGTFLAEMFVYITYSVLRNVQAVLRDENDF